MDMSKATEARSDQINYVDLLDGGTKEIKVTGAHLVDDGQGGYRTVINYEGGEGRPYKPSKGMDRLIQSPNGWGSNSEDWIGKSILLVGNKDVIWAGKAIGGLQIKALSHIEKGGFNEFVALNRSKRRIYKVEYLEPTMQQPTGDDLSWVESIKAGTNKLEDIVDEVRRNFIETLLK